MKYAMIPFSLLISLMIISCSGTHSNQNKDKPELEKGKVIPSVACMKNVSHTYALYLPANYSEEKKYPLIICFDAHGSGNKAVDLFHEAAEKYGYIIAGSNVSKNGMPMPATYEHYDIMLDDLLTRLSIDKQRIYTCGFSGGSRVAGSIAMIKGGIAGVIACSAGLPQTGERIKQKFDYFGYAGTEDMNYIEMVAMDRNLENSGFRHQLLIFEGTHDWPPKENIGESIVWTELNAMKDGKKTIDKAFIEAQLTEMDKALAGLHEAKLPYNEYLQCKKIINYFTGLTEVKKYEDRLVLLEKNAAVKSGIKSSENEVNNEVGLQQQYLERLSFENMDWWKGEVKRLNQFIATTKDQNEKHLLKRILEYLSLVLYSRSSGAYASGNDADAAHFATLYALIDADNPEPEFILSQLSARQKDIDKAIQHLQKAAELGFKEKARIEQDSIFLKLQSDSRYTGIITTVEKNQAQKP